MNEFYARCCMSGMSGSCCFFAGGWQDADTIGIIRCLTSYCRTWFLDLFVVLCSRMTLWVQIHVVYFSTSVATSKHNVHLYVSKGTSSSQYVVRLLTFYEQWATIKLDNTWCSRCKYFQTWQCWTFLVFQQAFTSAAGSQENSSVGFLGFKTNFSPRRTDFDAQWR